MRKGEFEKDLAEAQRRILAQQRELEKEVAERQVVEELAKNLGVSADEIEEEIEKARWERANKRKAQVRILPSWLIVGAAFGPIIVTLIKVFAR